MEVLDPEDNVLGRAERHVEVAEGQGQWQDDIKLEKPLPVGRSGMASRSLSLRI